MTKRWTSSLEVFEISSQTTRIIFRTEQLIEAPNWHPDGWFLVNGDGRLWRVNMAGGMQPIDTGGLHRCNNDHGFLPDGRIVFSCHNGHGAGIYLLDDDGPAEILPDRPSWWHGAYGDLLTYACVRGGDRVVRIATRDMMTGTERILTPEIAHHDGPDFSACGQYIWFNSDATGHAQIWRMNVDGSNAAPVFHDDSVNWFPHPSPCGQHVIYLAYAPGTEEHPRDKHVSIWIMSPDGKNRRQIVDLFGGQGTINVPCWSPDGQAFAFMRYSSD